jgi:hypothetical protein
VAFALEIAFRQSEESKGLKQELLAILNRANQFCIICWVIPEELRRLFNCELIAPLIEHVLEALARE